jgi:hypothetical protein
VRLVGLLETGTHGFFALAHSLCKSSEQTLAAQVVPSLKKGMLCLAARLFATYPLWQKAAATEVVSPKFSKKTGHGRWLGDET